MKEADTTAYFVTRERVNISRKGVHKPKLISRSSRNFKRCSGRSRTSPIQSQRPRPPCSPISHISSAFLPVTASPATEIMAFEENYQRPTSSQRTVVADSQVISCNRFSYQQVIRIHHSLQAQIVLDFIAGTETQSPFNSQARLSQVSTPR
jgi:hypothetical protein